LCMARSWKSTLPVRTLISDKLQNRPKVLGEECACADKPQDQKLN
jgi:hypothetical protein